MRRLGRKLGKRIPSARARRHAAELRRRERRPLDARRRWAPVRRRARMAIIGGALFALATLGIWAAARTEPAWYRIPTVPAADRQKVRNNLVAAEQAWTESLLGGQPFVYHLFQDDLNRWLAMRREIYPLLDELTLQEFADPFVRFHDGTVTLSGRYRGRGGGVVVSVELSARVESDEIVLQARAARCGRLPIPLAALDSLLGRSIDRPRDRTWPGSPRIRGNLRDGLRLESRAWWRNGGVDYRVRQIGIGEGQLQLDVLPLGRHDHSRRRRQS